MRTIRLQKFVFIFSSIGIMLITTHCGAQKYYADFKNSKKEVDTLVLLTPLINVEFLKNKEFLKDDELGNRLEQYLHNYLHSYFKKKYQLIDFELNYDTINYKELSNLFLLLMRIKS